MLEIAIAIIVVAVLIVTCATVLINVAADVFKKLWD